ncbi:asparagine synthase-related protein [Aestuariivivens sp. NBU2969]|uniref:asparagine synthase-related protein n=1 Tax=Aestuariivivens sp. NBU2969 TaxID=2873267 RepID=UPI001CBBD316|nr:asparagine synthase-related protein [Aestuariivivens sp. NBU2969]
MRTITTPIIPTHQTFAKVNAPHELHLEAICVFAAIGFFLDRDTYWKDQAVLSPASQHTLDGDGYLIDSEPWFKWHNTPQAISFNDTLDAFSELFETIVKEQTNGKQVILPLSGGLDSRTQAVALKQLDADVFSYSYAFENGYPETKIAQLIANTCGFEFEDYVIPKGYLWSVIDDLTNINNCYSDFTSPRQMAVINNLQGKGDVLSLGHWGDVLFDSMNLPQLSFEETVEVLPKKLIKRGGLEFAQALWQYWGLQGNFMDYFRSRISGLLSKIDIEDTNAKLRAFKSLYWAPRWTSVSLSTFKRIAPISLPYYDNRLCEFICTLPEYYLTGRQLQIAYIKRYAPALAKITLQDHRPFHLYNYHFDKVPYNLPYRFLKKMQRVISSIKGLPYVQRNWELQFLGRSNQEELLKRINDRDFNDFIPKELVTTYNNEFFNKDTLQYAHPMNMLLVLSQFYKTQVHG